MPPQHPPQGLLAKKKGEWLLGMTVPASQFSRGSTCPLGVSKASRGRRGGRKMGTSISCKIYSSCFSS